MSQHHNWLGSRANLDKLDHSHEQIHNDNSNLNVSPHNITDNILPNAPPFSVESPQNPHQEQSPKSVSPSKIHTTGHKQTVTRRRILINTEPSAELESQNVGKKFNNGALSLPTIMQAAPASTSMKSDQPDPAGQHQHQHQHHHHHHHQRQNLGEVESSALGASNKVRTSKYTLLSFLPKNLFEQFRSIANFYFLSLVVLQAFPPFALVSTILTAAPILLIVLVTAIKDGIEDWRRHQADENVNHAKTYLLANARNWNFPPITDHILSSSNNKRLQRQPSDLISVLKAEVGEFGNQSRSSKKEKPFHNEAPFWQQNNWEDVRAGDFVFLQNDESIPADVFIVSTSEPENACYLETKQLDGETNLKVRRGLQQLSGISSFPCDCEFIVGHIDCELPSPNLFSCNGVITIDLTKLSGTGNHHLHHRSGGALHDAKAHYKTFPITMSSMLLRGCVLRNTKWVIGIVIYTGADTKIMKNSGITPSKRSKIDRQLNPLNMVPISLYISVDVSKTVQSLFISMDQDMYDAESDKYASPRSWNLPDDLGQIEYIFSDKTGTLTCNTMEFRKCSINGVVYGTAFAMDMDEADAIARRNPQEPTSTKLPQQQQPPQSEKDSKESERRKFAESVMKNQLAQLFDTKYLAKNLSFVDTTLPIHLKGEDFGGRNDLEREQSRKIREFFSLLAICHTVLVEKPEGNVNPNHIEYRAQSPDEAALVAAARDVGFAFLKRFDDIAEVDLMGQMREYKILNVLEFNSDRKRMSVIIKRPEGQIILLVKGADSVIYERLAPATIPSDKTLRDTTLKHLEAFANDGLRTLCLAYRVLPHYEYEAWVEKYRAAQNAMQDREKTIDAVAELVEQNLTLMGATAIEDRLQDGVPETIATLAKAGIKIWVLTGDKMETAINIGFAANLLKKNMVLIVINSSSLKETFVQLLEALEKFWHPNAMCLAIGDGANDVSMIQEADIGIGISGKEGMQAVMASDYAISQFRFLKKLLLVHGRWGYFDCGFIGFFEQDLNCEISMIVPEIYRKGMKQQVFNLERYWIYMIDALWQSVITYYFVCGIYNDSVPNNSGYGGDHDCMGAIMAYICIICVNAHAVINTTNWTSQTVFGLVVSYLIWLIYVLIYTATFASPPYGQFQTLYSEAHFYLSIVIVGNVLNVDLEEPSSDAAVAVVTNTVAAVDKQQILSSERNRLSLENQEILPNYAILQHLPPLKTVNSDNAFQISRKSETRRLDSQNQLSRSKSELSVVLLSERAAVSGTGKSVIVHDETERLAHKLNFNIPVSSISSIPGYVTELKSESGNGAGAENLIRRSLTELENYKIKSPDGFLSFPIRRQQSETVLRNHGDLEWINMIDLGKNQSQKNLQTPAIPKREALRINTNMTSIIFMGTQEEVPNTGYCFSHAEGMMDLITPSPNRTSKMDMNIDPLSPR
ncbi:hypothetical protein HK100_001733, partial [Physocladia obscura]